MPPPSHPIVSAAELEALISGWGRQGTDDVDRFYPLRMAFLFLAVTGFAMVLLLLPSEVARQVATPGSGLSLERATRFFYVRGWVQLLTVLLGLYAYFRAWYPGLVFGALGLTAGVLLVVDLLIIYPPFADGPSVVFTGVIALRLLAVACLFLNMLNGLRLPQGRQRLDLLLFLRRQSV